MSSLLFQHTSKSCLIDASAYYLQADYSLIVAPKQELLSSTARISIDTLTLSFYSEQHILISLDDYTNLELWESRFLTMPEFIKDGSLSCLASFDENGIREGNSLTLQYSFCQDTGILLIQLIEVAQKPIINYIRCLSCVVCGLDIDGELIEIWIEGLKIN